MGKVHQIQRIDPQGRREFLKKAASLAGMGALGAIAGSMSMPVLAAPTTNWNQGPGSMTETADFIIFTSNGGQWYRRRGDTGAIDDNSEADSPSTDPVPMINRAINSMSAGQRLVVRGNFSSATTLLYNVYITYHHYGQMSYTGSGDAVRLDCGAQANQDSGGDIWIQRMLFPNGNPIDSAAIAVHVNNFVRSTFRVGAIGLNAQDASGTQAPKQGIVIDCSGGSFAHVIADNWFWFNTIRAGIGIHFLAGGGNGGFGEGNRFMGEINQIAGATQGILFDAGPDFNYTDFLFVTDDMGTICPSYVNNNPTSVGLVGIFLYLNDAASVPNVYAGTEGFWVGNVNSIGNGTGFNRGGVLSVNSTIQLKLKQIALSVPQTNTSIAVTFPVLATNVTMIDTNYQVSVETNWGTTWWITNKTSTGCTINFGTAAPASAFISYHVTR